jgi:hypothetical protein
LDFSSMNALRDILFRPRRAAESLRAQPRWLGPFLLLALLSAVLYALGSEGRIDELIRHLPPSADEAARSQVHENLRADLWRNTLFLPYRLALGWGGFAALLFMSGRALSRERATTYRHVFALETHAELILLFPSLLPLAGLPVPSLALVDSPFFADSLLRAANCFTLWYILALSAGMAVLFELRTRTAFLVVAVCWGMTESLNIGILHLLTRSFHFHL